MLSIRSSATLSVMMLVSTSSWASLTDDLGVMAEFDQKTKTTISKTLSTVNATKVFMNAHQTNPNALYWIDRKPDNTYHITLSLLGKKGGGALTKSELSNLKKELGKFKSQAKGLKLTRKRGIKGYAGRGYELVLFTHSFQNGQEIHRAYNAHTIQNLPYTHQNLPISYANLVLRVGTYAPAKSKKQTEVRSTLRDDWTKKENQLLRHPKSILIKKTNHELKTHITIANFHKYDARKYGLRTIGNRVTIEDKQNPGKKAYNIPFTSSNELQLLVDAFRATDQDFKAKGGKVALKIGEIHLTERIRQGNTYSKKTHTKVKL